MVKFTPTSVQAMVSELQEQLLVMSGRAQALAAQLAEEKTAHELTKTSLADREKELEELKKPAPPDDGPTQDAKSAD